MNPVDLQRKKISADQMAWPVRVGWVKSLCNHLKVKIFKSQLFPLTTLYSNPSKGVGSLSRSLSAHLLRDVDENGRREVDSLQIRSVELAVVEDVRGDHLDVVQRPILKDCKWVRRC